MKKPGRKRSSKNTPAHINADKLPDRVWFNTSGVGKWMLNYYDEQNNRKTKRICGPEAKLAEIWQAVEAQQKKTIATFTTLSLEFQQTHTWHKLSLSTQAYYRGCHHAITTRPTSTGNLGDVPITQWTVGLIRRYRDKRAEESESRANKDLSYIKRVFSWAYEYEKVPANPKYLSYCFIWGERRGSNPRQPESQFYLHFIKINSLMWFYCNHLSL